MSLIYHSMCENTANEYDIHKTLHDFIFVKLKIKHAHAMYKATMLFTL